MRHKIVAFIILILSIFNLVLAAPVPALEIREASTDVAEVDGDVIIISGKRAALGNPYERMYSDSGSDSASESSTGVDMLASSSSGGGPLLGSEVLSTPGGTGVPSDLKSAIKPATTTEDQPASSSATKKVSWGSTNKVHFFNSYDPPSVKLEDKRPGEEEVHTAPDEGYSSGSDEAHHSGPEEAYFSESDEEDHFLSPSRDDTYLATQHLPPPEIEHMPSPSNSDLYPPHSPESSGLVGDKLPLPPGREGYLKKIAMQQSPSSLPTMSPIDSDLYPPPTSKSDRFFKKTFGRLGKLKFKFWPRFQHTVDTGALL